MRAMTEAASEAPVPLWRTLAGLMLDPGGAVRRGLGDIGIAAALAVPGMAFTLFFLQSGLDRVRTGTIEGAGVALLTGAGLLFGTLGVALVALVGWGAVRALGGAIALAEALKAFALCYTPTLIYTLLGIVCNLALGWNTALAFGVTGVLWALGPMTGAVREMLGGRLWPALAVSTLCGLIVLYGWSLLGALA